MTSGRSGRPGLDRATVALVALSIIVLAGLVVLTAAVAWLAVSASGWWKWPLVVFGTLVVWLLVPRPPRVEDDVVLLSRADAPQLWRLVDTVAAGMGTRPPDLLGVDTAFNAYVVRLGWRRRQLLVIGLPLWSTQRPQERVAVLAHELGHLRHGDTTRGRITTAAMNVLVNIVDLLWPSLLDRPEASYGELAFLSWLSNGLRRTLALPAIGLLLVAIRLDARSSQREEYLADLGSARLAGREPAAMSLHRLLAMVGVEAHVGSAIRRGEDPWAALDAVVAPPERELRRLLLASARQCHSVDASHPPTHLRVSVVRSIAEVGGEVRLDAVWDDRIRRELEPVRARVRKCLRDELLHG